MTRRVLLPVAVLCALVRGHVAAAHSFEPAVLDVREHGAGVFQIVWRLPGPEAGSFLPGDPIPQPVLPAHCRVLGAVPEAPQFDAPVSWRADCGPAGLRGAALAVSGLGSRLEVIVRVTWRDGERVSAVLRAGDEAFVLPAVSGTAGATGRGAVALAYGRLGVEHILLGIDHLLFVLALLLLVESWAALVKTISAFTVGHSVSLALAVLGVVQLPPPLVEALIAASIVLVAVELTRTGGAPTLTRRTPWAVAFAFGLLHGLGFAGALADIGLPREQMALALVAFNVGVEFGQLLFVAVMLLPRRWLRAASARWAVVDALPAYAIGSLAVAWTFERVGQFWVPQ